MRLPSPTPLLLLVAQKALYITKEAGVSQTSLNYGAEEEVRKLASSRAWNKSGRVSFLEKEGAHRVNFLHDLLNDDGSFFSEGCPGGGKVAFIIPKDPDVGKDEVVVAGGDGFAHRFAIFRSH